MTLGATMQGAGTSLGLIGLILLFVFGTPFRPRSRGEVFLVTGDADEAEQARKRLQDLGSWVGFGVAVTGAVLQIAGLFV